MAETLIRECEDYLRARTGCYAWRSARYRGVASRLLLLGLTDEDLVVDVGAGWTEFDYYLRTEAGWRGRYMPVDGMLDGTDLEAWEPPRPAEFFVAIELLEHLRNPHRLIAAMKRSAGKGVVMTTPNPATTDVLGMDPTHRTAISRSDLHREGFVVTEESFYGGARDSLLGWWRR